jgi:hypothetical protein
MDKAQDNGPVQYGVTHSAARRLDILIEHEEGEVRRLVRRVQEVKATDPKRAQARCVKLHRTRMFLARLRRDREALP